MHGDKQAGKGLLHFPSALQVVLRNPIVTKHYRGSETKLSVQKWIFNTVLSINIKWKPRYLPTWSRFFENCIAV